MQEIGSVISLIMLLTFIGIGPKACDTAEIWLDNKQAEMKTSQIGKK